MGALASGFVCLRPELPAPFPAGPLPCKAEPDPTHDRAGGGGHPS